MTPAQSVTPRPSLIRRYVAIVSAALLAAAWAVGISTPASAAPVKGSLEIVSITDTGSGLGAPVQDRPFNVVVRVLDAAGQPTTVNQATTIILEEVSGPGDLDGTTTAVIPRNGSSATISGATYSQFANGVVLRVSARSGVNLVPDEVTVDVAVTAVGANASPGRSLNLSDPNCTCRTAGDIEALVITAIANLKDSAGNPLYSRASPATVVLGCDKDLCRELANGVPKIPVLYTLDNTGTLDKVAPECPAKGVLGEGQEACVDYVQSSRQQGDLYLYLLFAADIRCSG
jgi:hypothetical protein